MIAAPPPAPATALTLALAADAREPLGVWGGWGAFRDAGRCFAIAEPAGPRRRSRPFVGVVRAPGRGGAPMLWARLSSPALAAAAVTLSVGERRFVLSARGSAAWSGDAAAARALVAALRGERSMSVEWTGADGRPHADAYPLAGAATAIDAAALGCLAGR